MASLARLDLDAAAISGLAGAISIACWVVVFSPQVIENFRRSSAEGLSIEFVVIWLFGDIANIIGAVLQRVLPTMLVLAIYYTLADVVLLAQCFYYRGITTHGKHDQPTETTPLFQDSALESDDDLLSPDMHTHGRSTSIVTVGERLSPATPMHAHPTKSPAAAMWKKALFNLTAVALVFASGVLGYLLSPSAPPLSDADNRAHERQDLRFNITGQVFGYLCAALYLGSRVPQLLLNYRRKSTEGLNALFFVFACLGNLMYTSSIFAYEAACLHDHDHSRGCAPGEAKAVYARYLLVNASWIVGSLGTLLLDMGVFTQFFMYNRDRAVI